MLRKDKILQLIHLLRLALVLTLSLNACLVYAENIMQSDLDTDTIALENDSFSTLPAEENATEEASLSFEKTVPAKDGVMSTRLQADNVEYDEKKDIIKAWGHVEITRLDATLFADEVIYDRKEDLIYAHGNVWLYSKDGNLSRTDAIEITGDLKESVSEAISGIMTDNARYVALSSTRHEGHILKFKRVLYSPCQICRRQDLPNPTWQLRSRNLTYDEDTDMVEHLDTTLEIKGIPIMYFPYLYHPGPKTKRKSGVLSPTLGASSDIGPIFGLPIFWAIDESQDLTVTPYYNRENSLLGLTYRKAFCRGYLRLHAVGTSGDYKVMHNRTLVPKKGFRGYSEVEALAAFNRHWRAGLHLKHATDDTFLKRYQFLGYSQEAFLTTRGYLEGFYGRNYFLAEGLYYQSLRQTDKSSEVPYIVPNMEASLASKPDEYGGNWILDASLMNLMRDRGARTQRLSSLGGYQKRWFSNMGIVTHAVATARVDAYHILHYPLGPAPAAGRPDNRQRFSGTRDRFIPTLGITSSMPFLKITKPGRLIIEPKIGLVLTGSGKNSKDIPDEDSNGFELSDSNLFLNSRVPGLDLVDDLSRLNYGIKFAFLSTEYGHSDVFLGQSHSLEKVPDAQRSSGLSKRTSDYVVGAKFNYKNWITLQSKLLLKHTDFSARRNESTAGIGPKIFRWNVTYSKFQKLQDPNQRPEQVTYGFSSKFMQNWTFRASTTQQLGGKRATLTSSGGLVFEDDCLMLDARVTRNHFEDRDLKPSTLFLLTFSFKNLGGYTLSRGRNNNNKAKTS